MFLPEGIGAAALLVDGVQLVVVGCEWGRGLDSSIRGSVLSGARVRVGGSCYDAHNFLISFDFLLFLIYLSYDFCWVGMGWCCAWVFDCLSYVGGYWMGFHGRGGRGIYVSG